MDASLIVSTIVPPFVVFHFPLSLNIYQAFLRIAIVPGDRLVNIFHSASLTDSTIAIGARIAPVNIVEAGQKNEWTQRNTPVCTG